jgi:hypothetical protein
MLYLLLIVIAIVALTGVGPYWDYSREWGYTPSGFVFALFLVLSCC